MEVSKDELKRQLSEKYGEWATPILESHSFQDTLDRKIQRQQGLPTPTNTNDPYGNEAP